MQYNLQPYGKDSDTTGERTIPWFRKNWLETVKDYLPKKRDTALDVGCGNGRFNPILKEFGFKEVTGIDPVEKPNPKYFQFIYMNSGNKEYGNQYLKHEYRGFTFEKLFLHEYVIRNIQNKKPKVDVAFFFGSYHILRQIYRNGFFALVKDVADLAILMMDVSDYMIFEDEYGELDFNFRVKSTTGGRTVIIKMES